MTLASSLVERPDMVIPGKNGTGSDIAEKLFVTGYNDAISLPAANTDPILGVTMAGGAKNGKYGSVMTRGLAIITCAGSVTKGTRVMSDTAGKAVTWTTGKAIGGIAMTDGTNEDIM